MKFLMSILSLLAREDNPPYWLLQLLLISWPQNDEDDAESEPEHCTDSSTTDGEGPDTALCISRAGGVTTGHSKERKDSEEEEKERLEEDALEKQAEMDRSVAWLIQNARERASLTTRGRKKGLNRGFGRE